MKVAQNDVEGEEHVREEVMPELIKRISDPSVSGMSTIAIQPPEGIKSKVVVIHD